MLRLENRILDPLLPNPDGSLCFLAGTIWMRTPSGPITKTELPLMSVLKPGTTRLTVARAASLEAQKRIEWNN